MIQPAFHQISNWAQSTGIHLVLILKNKLRWVEKHFFPCSVFKYSPSIISKNESFSAKLNLPYSHGSYTNTNQCTLLLFCGDKVKNKKRVYFSPLWPFVCFCGIFLLDLWLVKECSYSSFSCRVKYYLIIRDIQYPTLLGCQLLLRHPAPSLCSHPPIPRVFGPAQLHAVSQLPALYEKGL